MLYFFVVLNIFFQPSQADELTRSDMTNKFWIEGASGIAPDSGVFHGEGSAVADRRDISLRYQHGTFGVLVNWHRANLSWELEQESYSVSNRVYGGGFTVRVSPFGDKGGGLGGSHLVGYLMAQYGRSDFHYFEGPSGGSKTEITAGVVNASGFASGVDYYFPAFFGLWLSAGAGLESNNFSYKKITSDPNNDGKVNIRQTFTYLRAGLALSF